MACLPTRNDVGDLEPRLATEWLNIIRFGGRLREYSNLWRRLGASPASGLPGPDVQLPDDRRGMTWWILPDLMTSLTPQRVAHAGLAQEVGVVRLSPLPSFSQAPGPC